MLSQFKPFNYPPLPSFKLPFVTTSIHWPSIIIYLSQQCRHFLCVHKSAVLLDCDRVLGFAAAMLALLPCHSVERLFVSPQAFFEFESKVAIAWSKCASSPKYACTTGYIYLTYEFTEITIIKSIISQKVTFITSLVR